MGGMNHLEPKHTLVATKLSPPQSIASEVIRHSIAHETEEATLPSICLVAAAGSGKSTYMRQLFEQRSKDGCVCAWLSLDERDNDPARLMPYLIDALAKVSSDFAATTKIPLDFSDRDTLARTFSTLEMLITQIDVKSTLFMDDFHFIQNPVLLQHFNHLLDVCEAPLKRHNRHKRASRNSNPTAHLIRAVCCCVRRFSEIHAARNRAVFSRTR